MKHYYTRKCYLIKHPWHAALKLRQEVVSIIHSLSVYRQCSVVGVEGKGERTSTAKSPLVLLLYSTLQRDVADYLKFYQFFLIL